MAEKRTRLLTVLLEDGYGWQDFDLSDENLVRYDSDSETLIVYKSPQDKETALLALKKFIVAYITSKV